MLIGDVVNIAKCSEQVSEDVKDGSEAIKLTTMGCL
jgi:hypothetical protein